MPLLDRLLGLAWSLWAELGVSAWDRRHANWDVDPEALILFTAALADVDPRLRDESLDWCIRNHRYVSAARLRNMLRNELAPAGPAFGPYAATVRADAPVNWPTTQEARPYRPTGKSRLADLGQPALMRLRLRALFGTSARAEIIAVFAAYPDREHTAAAIADVAHFTKRNVELELRALQQAGLLGGATVRGQVEFRLARRDALLAFVGDRPEHWPRWAPVLRTLLDALALLTSETELPLRVRAVEATKFARSLQRDPTRVGLVPPDQIVGSDAWEQLGCWIRRTAAALADGEPSVLT